jgi:hypothetical protein
VKKLIVYNLEHGNIDSAFTFFTEIRSFSVKLCLCGILQVFLEPFWTFFCLFVHSIASFFLVLLLLFFCCLHSIVHLVWLSRIGSYKTVQIWSIKTCKILLRYKSTNKLEKDLMLTVFSWKKKLLVWDEKWTIETKKPKNVRKSSECYKHKKL